MLLVNYGNFANVCISVTFGVYIWFPAISVVSMRHSGPLWCVRHPRCHDSLMNIEQQALEATSGPRVLLGGGGGVGDSFLT